MAVRTADSSGRSSRAWVVALTLVVLFAAAIFLRAYWNLDAAQEGGRFVLSGGSDPYYEKRAIDAIQDSGYHTLIQDPLLNYPYGSINPNPPLYQWSVAMAGHMLSPLFSADPAHGLSAEQVATWWATEWAPVIYGALTILPIYFIGKTLFDRRVGVLAALFWVVSTESIDVTGLGDSRHYASALFFASLAFLFYIKTIEQFRGDGNWVKRWPGDVGTGLSSMFRARGLGFAYALLTAISIAAVALMWKGFPYVIGIIFAYAVLQMVIDHWRNKDTTGLFLASLIAMLLGTLIAYPYYVQAGVANFVQPVWYIIAAFVAAGIVLVPTRDLPTILVMPAAIIVGALAIAASFFVFPDVARGLLYSTVYFKQTSLYTTIAEAHPADFSNMVFSIGIVPFFAAVFGFVFLLFTLRRRPTRAILFALVWAAVAVFMAHSAVRFVFNAVPIFAVLGAFMLVWVLDWFEFSAIRKSLAANQGNFWQGLRKGTRPGHIVAVILVVLLLVIPNGLFAADAAIPQNDEAKYAANSNSDFVKGFWNREMGAYGQGFLPQYWEDGFTFLDQFDHNQTDLAKRPAFLSWWDYGHWAIYVGKHPTVADNFQNGYAFAAKFILSQNETNAVQLLAARLSVLDDSNTQAALTAVGDNNSAADATTLANCNYTDRINGCKPIALSLDQSVKLLAALEKNTQKSIRYYAADIRMLPYDDPSTTGTIEQSSIFYAPVKLANENPDDYVATKLNLGGQWVTQAQYEQNVSDPVHRVQATGERYEYTDQFFGSMFYHAYVGTPPQVTSSPILGDVLRNGINNPRPGFGMEHFRLIYADSALRILAYYPGSPVSGKLVDETGAPIAGATVASYDDAGTIILNAFPASVRSQVNVEDFNVVHSSATTAADGTFTVLAPYAMPGGNVTILAEKDNVELGRAHVAIAREDADPAPGVVPKSFSGADIQVKHGSVAGLAFQDANGNGTLEAGEASVAGLNVTIGGVSATTDANGNYTIAGIPAGRQNVTIESDRFQLASTSAVVSVRPGVSTPLNLALTLKKGSVSGQLVAADKPVPQQTITFEPTSAANNTAKLTNAFTQLDGNFTIALTPGEYLMNATFTDTNATYVLQQTITVGVGETIANQTYTMVAKPAGG